MRLRPACANAIEDARGERLILNERRITVCDRHIGFSEHHLHVVECRSEEGPRLRHLTKQALILERVQSVTYAVPAWQHHTSLGPAEYPRDRAQIFNAIRLRSRC